MVNAQNPLRQCVHNYIKISDNLSTTISCNFMFVALCHQNAPVIMKNIYLRVDE